MGRIVVDHKSYEVVETLPATQHPGGAKIVLDNGLERVAVKEGGVWRWWTAEDRLGTRRAIRPEET